MYCPSSPAAGAVYLGVVDIPGDVVPSPMRRAPPTVPRVLVTNEGATLRLRRTLLSLLGIGGMVVGLFAVSIANRVPEPFNIPLIVVGIIASVTGGLVFGVVAVAWVMGQAVQWSESSHWGRSRKP